MSPSEVWKSLSWPDILGFMAHMCHAHPVGLMMLMEETLQHVGCKCKRSCGYNQQHQQPKTLVTRFFFHQQGGSMINSEYSETTALSRSAEVKRLTKSVGGTRNQWCLATVQNSKLHPRSLTACPWKMVAGRRSFPIGKFNFQGLCYNSRG